MLQAFEGLEKTRTDEELLELCKERLVALAVRGELEITPLFKLPPRVKDNCGMVLQGLRWVRANTDRGRASNPTRTHDSAPPPELAGYQVAVAAHGQLADDPDHPLHGRVAWRTEPKETHRLVGGNAKLGLDYDETLTFVRDDIATMNSPATVSAPLAYEILRQSGAHCVYAKRPEHQRQRWQTIELPRSRGNARSKK